MGYPVYTKSLVCYIEANIMNGKLDYNELEKILDILNHIYVRYSVMIWDVHLQSI